MINCAIDHRGGDNSFNLRQCTTVSVEQMLLHTESATTNRNCYSYSVPPHLKGSPLCSNEQRQPEPCGFWTPHSMRQSTRWS